MGDSASTPMTPAEKEELKRKYKEHVLEKKRLKLETSKLNNSNVNNNTTVVSSVSVSISKPVQLEDVSNGTPIKFSQSLPSHVHSPPGRGPASPLYKSTPMSSPIQNKRRSLRQRTLQIAEQQKKTTASVKKRILKQIDEDEGVVEVENSNNSGSNKNMVEDRFDEEKEVEIGRENSNKKIKISNATLIQNMEVLALNNNNSNNIEVEGNKEEPMAEEGENEKIEIEVNDEMERKVESDREIEKETSSPSPASSNNNQNVINVIEADREKKKNLIKFLNKEERIRCRKFRNFDMIDYQTKEIDGYDQKLNIYSIKNENQKFNESYPGVLSTVLIDRKVAYLKIEAKTSRPFEFKKSANLFFTVIEGSILLKSQELTDDSITSGVKYLQSVKISLGESFCVPAGVLYCLINMEETEAKLVLFAEKI